MIRPFEEKVLALIVVEDGYFDEKIAETYIGREKLWVVEPWIMDSRGETTMG